MRRVAGSWRRRAAAAAAFAGAFLIIASPASGQGSPYQAGPWQISAMGGWYSGSTPYIFEGPFRSNVKMTSSATFGMRLGYDFRTWGLEWSWWQARPDEKFETHSPVFIRQVRLDTYEFNGLLYLNQCGLRPFLVFGVGGADTASSLGGVNLTASAGGGIKAFLDRHFVLRLEGRFRATYGNIGQPGGSAFCDSGGCYYYRRSWYYSSEVAAGVGYAF